MINRGSCCIYKAHTLLLVLHCSLFPFPFQPSFLHVCFRRHERHFSIFFHRHLAIRRRKIGCSDIDIHVDVGAGKAVWVSLIRGHPQYLFHDPKLHLYQSNNSCHGFPPLLVRSGDITAQPLGRLSLVRLAVLVSLTLVMFSQTCLVKVTGSTSPRQRVHGTTQGPD
jgi:hypothetical protein